MKNVLLLIAFSLSGTVINAMPEDTTIVVNGKRIEIEETNERMKVRVYEQTEKEGLIEDEMVFEGHYKDGRSYENRKHVRSIHIHIPTWHRRFSPHWAGAGMGFTNFADSKLEQINDVEGVSLRSGNSLEYNLNFLETSFLFSRKSGWAVVTGAGMRWSRYQVHGNQYFSELDGFTSLHPAPEGITYSSSRLNITSLTLPVLLEWQNRRKEDKSFFISAGVVGVVKTISSSKVTYKDPSDKKRTDKMDSGMNLRPITIDFLLQAGYDWIGLYARYSPMGLFEGGKGPKIHPVSIGLQFHL
ncbi:MAG: PorT family protein [Tannerellaceae bacterium]|jgi:hypothetical protein|nr:PorT family protein [Tannerellaceae bacterium]